MTSSAAPEIKICGITRREDAEAAAEAGADYLGVILAASGPRQVTAAQAAELLAGLPIRRVGVFVDIPAEQVEAGAEEAELDVVQLHGDETPELAASLRCSGREVWKAVHPRTEAEFLSAIHRYEDAADALLLDGWNPAAAGGTGTRFPWSEIGEGRAALPATLRLIAAGGLTPDNVAEAIDRVRPQVVDVSSGVESSPGHKDAARVRRFIAAARGSASS
jgi:phosphoribosylanthranilate isomerase